MRFPLRQVFLGIFILGFLEQNKEEVSCSRMAIGLRMTSGQSTPILPFALPPSHPLSLMVRADDWR